MPGSVQPTTAYRLPLLPDPRLLAGRDGLVVVIAAGVVPLDPAEQVYLAVDVGSPGIAAAASEMMRLNRRLRLLPDSRL
jgi:hypothetical protein